MCADVIVAAESAVIGDAHANYGVYPGAGGAAILPRLIPLNMAMYLLLTGKSLAAAEMKACGLVCEVHPDDALDGAVMALAQQIAAKSPIALARMKEVARASADKSRADALLHEQVLLRRHLRSVDLQEGLRAFAKSGRLVSKVADPRRSIEESNMNDIYVVGVGMTQFGRLPNCTVYDLVGEAVSLALQDAELRNSRHRFRLTSPTRPPGRSRDRLRSRGRSPCVAAASRAFRCLASKTPARRAPPPSIWPRWLCKRASATWRWPSARRR